MPDVGYSGYHLIRVINNTCTIVLSLLYGEDGLQKETRLILMVTSAPGEYVWDTTHLGFNAWSERRRVRLSYPYFQMLSWMSERIAMSILQTSWQLQTSEVLVKDSA